MPLRSELLTNRWSTVDLPILPFLAPRVFKPWPCRPRRVHSATQASRTSPEVSVRDYDNWHQYTSREGIPVEKGSRTWEREQGQSGIRTPPIIGIQNNGGVSRGFETSLNPGNSGLDTESIKGGSAGKLIDQEFERKYEEIWGTREKKRIREDEEQRPTRIMPSASKDKGTIYNSYRTRMSKHDPERKPGTPSARADLPRLTNRRNAKSIHSLNQAEVRRLGIPRGRTKWVKLDVGAEYDSEPFAGFWHKAFARLNLRHQVFKRGRVRPRLVVQDNLKFPQSLKRDLIQLDSKALQEKWESMPQTLRVQIWPELMTAALEHHPTEALKVLANTYSDPLPPSYAVTDSLEYIISHYLISSDDSRNYFALNLQKTIVLLLRHRPKHYFSLSQKSIYMLVSNLDDEHVEGFYKDLAELEHPLHTNTLMHFASRFAKSGRMDPGFEVLKELCLKKVDFNTPRMMSVCTSLLHRSYRKPDGHSTDSERFQLMLTLGMRPNVVTYNVLIQNALQAGDPETGWQIHGLMIENGVEPDGYTYSILLNDAKLRMDPSAIRSVMGYLRERGIKSPHVVTDVLHAILLLHQQEEQTSVTPLGPRETRQPAFERMLDVYLEHFQVSPLACLIPQFRERYFPALKTRLNKDEGLNPPGPTLVVMISGLLNDLGSQATKDLYEHFCQLALSKEPAILDLMSTTHVWNIFLLALGKFPDRLYDCPKVIGRMISRATKPATIKRDSTRSASECSPDNDHQQARERGYETSSSSPISSSSNAERQAVSPESPLYRATEHVGFEETGYPSVCGSSQHPTTLDQSDSQSEIHPTTSPEIQSPLTNQSISVTYPNPDIYTWSILLKIFTDHGQPRAAEKVLSAMQKRGITPNRITWNTLTSGYGRMQDAAMTADTVNRMEQAGFEPNVITMKALSGIRDRRVLMEAIKRKQLGTPKMGKGFVRSVTKGLIQDRAAEEAYISSKLTDEASGLEGGQTTKR